MEGARRATGMLPALAAQPTAFNHSLIKSAIFKVHTYEDICPVKIFLVIPRLSDLCFFSLKALLWVLAFKKLWVIPLKDLHILLDYLLAPAR